MYEKYGSSNLEFNNVDLKYFHYQQKQQTAKRIQNIHIEFNAFKKDGSAYEVFLFQTKKFNH